LERLEGRLADQPVTMRRVAISFGLSDEKLVSGAERHLDDRPLAVDALIDR
jgi:hypothetical protein